VTCGPNCNYGVQNYLNIFLLIGIILHNLQFWLGPVNLSFKYADRSQPKSYIMQISKTHLGNFEHHKYTNVRKVNPGNFIPMFKTEPFFLLLKLHHGCTKTIPKRLGGTPGKRLTPSNLKTPPKRLHVCAWKTTQRRLAERLGAESLSPPNRLRNVLWRVDLEATWKPSPPDL
jgi:hypothetical protein